MVISKKYRLNITDNVSHNFQLYFDNTSEVKRFMSHYYSASSMKVELYEVTTTWDLSTGTISQSQTQVTNL